MTATQQEQVEEIRETFAFFDDWEDRYRYLMEMGRELPPMNEIDKTEENRIQGCQSQVWLVPRTDGDLLFFDADSDSAIVKGLVAILWRVYSGQSANAVLSFDIEGFLKQLDLEEHLSMNRRNGLYSMIQKIKSLVERCG
ncbi:MAG: SufE family protein [Armatimonadetes bacterium]|nr:SufE family protein [Armatimonadota bacterium]